MDFAVGLISAKMLSTNFLQIRRSHCSIMGLLQASVKILSANFHFWSHPQKFCPAKIFHYMVIASELNSLHFYDINLFLMIE